MGTQVAIGESSTVQEAVSQLEGQYLSPSIAVPEAQDQEEDNKARQNSEPGNAGEDHAAGGGLGK